MLKFVVYEVIAEPCTVYAL